MKKILTTFSLFIIFTFILPLSNPIFAKEDGNEREDEMGTTSRENEEQEVENENQERENEEQEGENAREEKREAKEEKISAKRNEACRKAQIAVQNRLARYDGQPGRYSNLNTQFEGLISNLADDGYDVTEVQSKLAELNTLINEFDQLFQQYMASLSTIANMECNRPEDVKNALEDSRPELKAAQDKAQEIRKFVQNDFKPVLKLLRESVRDVDQI